jgi:hypothetical protein
VPWWRVVGWTLPFVFRRLRKSAESDSWLPYVCLAVRMNNFPSTGRIFIKFIIWVLFKTLSRFINFRCNRTRIAGTVHKHTFLIISRSILLRMRNVSEDVVEKPTHISYSITFSEEVMWKNIVEPDRPHLAIRRMRFACWIPKATHTRARAHVILVAFLLQQWFHERAPVLRYTYIAFVVYLVCTSVSARQASSSSACVYRCVLMFATFSMDIAVSRFKYMLIYTKNICQNLLCAGTLVNMLVKMRAVT